METLRNRIKVKPSGENDSTCDEDESFLRYENQKQQKQQEQQEQQEGKMKSSGLFGFLSQLDLKLLGAFTFLAVIVRMALLGNPSVVVFDEVHFGGFAAKYLRGEFFFDLHPPLARLLVTLSGWLSGFKGDFDFHDIGVDYTRHGVPYVGMRAFSAVFGVATIPFAFLTVLSCGGSRLAASSAALLVLFENALTTQSRLILLDSFLIFFTSAALLCWSLFRRQQEWTLPWWTSLTLTGASLGCAASCKWVGLFTVATVGVQVLSGLWGMWCDTLCPLKKIFKSFLARAVCLILLPAAIYVSTFWVHFHLLQGYSTTVASFTLQFQQNFAESRVPATNGPVYFGSTVTLRQDRRDSPGYLHSHDAMYPTGSKQQQVTIYHHRDANNQFVIKRPYLVNHTYTDADLDEPMEEEDLINVCHGDTVRLMHLLTGRFLHSHHESAPVSTKKEHHSEVSCYGHDLSRFSDLNDNWIVKIVGPDGEPLPVTAKLRSEAPKINALTQRLVFLHPHAGCVLHSNNKALPEWGFRQGEVTCGREVLKGHTHWKIESNEHPLHVDDENNAQVEHRRAGFWEMFAELHGRMWVVNAGLNSPHYFQSWPKDWPFLRRGLGFWNGGQIPRSDSEIKQSRSEKNPKEAADAPVVDNSEAEKEAYRESYKAQSESLKGRQIYLLGNVITWHSVTLAVFSLLSLLAAGFVVEQRIRFAPGFGRLRQGISFLWSLAAFEGPVSFMLGGWLFHYVPFYLMGRQLFLHHYLPALYCGILFMSLLLDRILPLSVKSRVFQTLVASAISSFLLYAPLAYGMEFPLCSLLKLKRQWDWECVKR